MNDLNDRTGHCIASNTMLPTPDTDPNPPAEEPPDLPPGRDPPVRDPHPDRYPVRDPPPHPDKPVSKQRAL